jgi:hypothetical protein
MYFKDLELSQELSCDEQAAVRGGVAANGVGALLGGSGLVNGGGGVSIGSPIIQVNPQIQTIVPTATNLDMNLNIASIVASANTLLGQV